MNKLQSLVERDQWAELLTSVSDLSKQSVNSNIEVLAFSDKSALDKASEIFNVPKSHLNLEKTKEGHSSLFGFIKTPASYLSSIKDEYKHTYVQSSIDYDEFNDLAKNKNGSFSLIMKKDGLFLQVFPPKGVGSIVTMANIMEELDRREYVDVHHPTLKQALDTFQPVIIAPYVRSEGDSTPYVSIGKDAMDATFRFTRPTGHGRIPETKEIVELLRREGVKIGIKEDFITEALDNELYDIPITAAEGIPAQNGENAYIEYMFALENDEEFKYAVRDDGSVDFKELNRIQNVFENDVLAVMHPATKGTVGHTVMGDRLEVTDGIPVEWNLGENVTLSEDKLQAIATQSGQVSIKNKQITVEPTLEIASDVDLSTGNIDFVGNVVIKGGVSDGFSVLSGGDLEIFGHIGKCYIYAQGNIIAHQGIQGKDEARIECNGNLYANFIERASVNTGGNLIVTKVLLHSKVISNKSIYVLDEKKSIIAGGDIKAQNEIVSAQIGAESYIETHIEAGYSKVLIQKNINIKKNIDTLTTQIHEYTEQINSTPPGSGLARKLSTLITNAEKQIEKHEQSFEQNRETLQKLRLASFISASKAFLPGVKMRIGSNTLDITAEQIAGTVKSDKDTQLVMGSYVPSQNVSIFANSEQKNR